jgi:hypothetical protein
MKIPNPLIIAVISVLAYVADANSESFYMLACQHFADVGIPF